jgi:hypothetical protein
MYQNLEAMANSVASLTSDVVPKEMKANLQAATLFQASLPKVVFVYGEQDRILGSAKGSFGIQIASMFGMRGLTEAAGMGGLWH